MSLAPSNCGNRRYLLAENPQAPGKEMKVIESNTHPTPYLGLVSLPPPVHPHHWSLAVVETMVEEIKVMVQLKLLENVLA